MPASPRQPPPPRCGQRCCCHLHPGTVVCGWAASPTSQHEKPGDSIVCPNAKTCSWGGTRWGVGEWIWIGCIIPIDDPRLLLLSLLLFRGNRAATPGRACSGGGICCVGSSDVHVSRLVLAHVLLALAVAYFHCDPPCAAAEEGSRHDRAGLTEQPGVRGPPRAEERGRFFAWLQQKQQRNKSGSSANSLPAKRGKPDNLPKPRSSSGIRGSQNLMAG